MLVIYIEIVPEGGGGGTLPYLPLDDVWFSGSSALISLFIVLNAVCFLEMI